MLKDIINSLSDTEIVVIAEEMSNKNVPLEYVIRQLIAKSSNNESLSTENETEILETLSLELSKRLNESNTKVSESKSE